MVFPYIRQSIAIILFAVATLAGAAEINAKVIAITDGDTCKVLDKNSVQYIIRLHGIDSPERKQAFGTQAKKYLSELIFGKEVKVVYSSKDRYGRILGKIYIGASYVNLKMVEAGFAWHYVKYAPKDDDLAKAEADARKGKVGLWGGEVLAPWEFRKGIRK